MQDSSSRLDIYPPATTPPPQPRLRYAASVQDELMSELPKEPPPLVSRENVGMPLAVLVRALKKQRINRFMRSLVLYVLFLVFITLIISEHQDVHESWEQGQGVVEGYDLFQQPFARVQDEASFWDWMEHSVVPVLFANATISRQNFVLGAVQLRQGRVGAKTCSLGAPARWGQEEEQGAAAAAAAAATAGGSRRVECAPTFQLGSTDMRAPFGGASSTSFAWRADAGSELWGVDGFGKNGHGSTRYGRGGYVVEIPSSASNATALATVRRMRREGWLSGATRYTLLSFTLYNPASRIAQSARLFAEFYRSGHVETKVSLNAMKVNVFSGGAGVLRMVGAVFLFVAFVLFVLVEALTCFYHLRCGRLLSHIYDFWTGLELVHLGSMAATVVLYIQLMRDRNFNNFSTVMSETSDTFVDVADTTALFAKFADVSAMLLLVSWLKVFKYLRINRKLTVLWDTMRNAMQEILSLAIVFVVLLSAFAFAGHILFGDKIKAFHNWESSFSYHMNTIVGNIDYNSLAEAAPTVAPIYFSVWVFTVFLVLVNMFIAVICDHSSRVSSEGEDVSERMRPSMINGPRTELLELISCCCSRHVGDFLLRLKDSFARAEQQPLPKHDPLLHSIKDFVTQNARDRMRRRGSVFIDKKRKKSGSGRAAGPDAPVPMEEAEARLSALDSPPPAAAPGPGTPPPTQQQQQRAVILSEMERKREINNQIDGMICRANQLLLRDGVDSQPVQREAGRRLTRSASFTNITSGIGGWCEVNVFDRMAQVFSLAHPLYDGVLAWWGSLSETDKIKTFVAQRELRSIFGPDTSDLLDGYHELLEMQAKSAMTQRKIKAAFDALFRVLRQGARGLVMDEKTAAEHVACIQQFMGEGWSRVAGQAFDSRQQLPKDAFLVPSVGSRGKVKMHWGGLRPIEDNLRALLDDAQQFSSPSKSLSASGSHRVVESEV